jgi:hypothetical protein
MKKIRSKTKQLEFTTQDGKVFFGPPPPPLPPHSAHGSVLLILLEICLIFTALPIKLENGYISNIDQKPELRIRIHLIRIQLLGPGSNSD